MKTLKNKKYFFLTLFILMCCLLLVGVAKLKTNVAYADNHSDTQQAIFENTIWGELFHEDGTIELVQLPVDNEDVSIQTYSDIPTFNERKIIDSGRPDSDSIVLTFLGDGFTETEQDKFISAATSAIDYLLGNPSKKIKGCYPFNEFRDYFTVYAIEVISNESGVSRDPVTNKKIVDNYFGSSFYGGSDTGIIERSLVIQNYGRVYELEKVNSAMTAIFCNSTTPGGTGGTVSVVSLDGTTSDTLLHEMGHTFGKLADEYYYVPDGKFRGYEAPNRTADNNENTIRWKSRLDYKDVGIYPYSTGVDRTATGFDSSTDSWYKPSLNCEMQYLNKEFCPVCSDELIKQLELRTENLFITKNLSSNEVAIVGLNERLYDDLSETLVVPENLYGKTVTEIGESAFQNCYNIKNVDLPNTIRSIGNGAFKNCYNMRRINLPNQITGIGDEVFSGCSKLSTISPLDYIKTIGDKAFMDCTSLEDFTIPMGVIHVGNGVFAGCNYLNLSVSTYNSNFSAQDNILYNKNRTRIIASGKIDPHIEVFNYVTEIAPYSFAKNNNLISLSISSVSKIGENAFNNCSNLKTVYYNSFTLPVLGENSFPNNNFALYVPYIKQSEYRLLFAEYTKNVLSNKVQLYFMSGDTTLDTKDAYYGEYIGDYLYVPKRKGYEFSGWYENAELTGVQYQTNDLINSPTTLCLYAKWDPVECKIVLDPKDGEIKGDAIVYVEYGSEFKLDATVTKVGYTFEGWYDSDNQLYAIADGSCTMPWRNIEETTLYAHWAIKSYEIRINNDGTITWLGPTGLSAEQCTIPFGTRLDAINLISKFKESEQGFKTGYIFDHFEYNDKTVSWAEVPDLGENGAVITILPVWELEQHTIYFNAMCEVIEKEIVANFGTAITLPTPYRLGYTFKGWFDDPYRGKQIAWRIMPDLTPITQSNGSQMLYARWEAYKYTISYYPNGGEGTMSPTTHTVGVSQKLSTNAFTRTGYKFMGWATSPSGTVRYVDAQSVLNLSYKQADSVKLYAVWEIEVYTITYVYNNGAGKVTNPTTYTVETKTFYLKSPSGTPKTGYKYVWNKSAITKGSTGDVTISSIVTPIVYKVTYSNQSGGLGAGFPAIPWIDIEYDQEYTFYQPDELEKGYVLDCWTLVNNRTDVKTKLGSGETCTIKNITTIDGEWFTLTAEYKKKTCVAEGTLITLADGTQKAVEQLTGDEMLLVWNLQTGTFDAAPILFIDSDPADTYEVTNLYFSDGTEVKVIYEHAFWDFDLNQYVFLRNDAAQYIGHWFNKQITDENGQLTWTKVQLTDVVVKDEYTTSWSPVTFSHLCYYVNGMLSMPGATEGLINIFEVDAETMSYNQEALAADVEQYGLFTYEEFAEILPVSQEVFEAFNGQYLKVSIGKGLIDIETLAELIERYSEYFVN